MGKIASIRVDEETLDKFKVLSEQFSNQGDCLNQLLTAYEINNAKHILTTVSTDIADYQTHIDSIQRAFLHILELNNNAEERIRQEFEVQLNSKDATILELQGQLSVVKEKLSTTISECELKSNELVKNNEHLHIENKSLLEKLTTSEKENSDKSQALSDKQLIINSLTARLPEQEETEQQLKELNQTISNLEKENKKLSDSVQKHEYDIKIMKQQSEFDIKQAILNEKEISQAKSEKQAEKIEKQSEIISELKEQVIKLSTK